MRKFYFIFYQCIPSLAIYVAISNVEMCCQLCSRTRVLTSPLYKRLHPKNIQVDDGKTFYRRYTSLSKAEESQARGGRSRLIKKGGFFGFFSFYVRYSTLLHLPPLRLHCVGGCWDQTQDSCNYGIGCQTH